MAKFGAETWINNSDFNIPTTAAKLSSNTVQIILNNFKDIRLK